MAKKDYQLKSHNLSAVLENGFSPCALPPMAAAGKSVQRVHQENVRVSLSSFTLENAPSDYQVLKEEVAFLEEVHTRSFLVLAHRLKIIRDRALYRSDGYNNFKSFLEGEMQITRRMVYNYIALLEALGETSVSQMNYHFTSLLKAVPYLKEHPSDRDLILEKVQALSVRDLQRELSKCYPDLKARRSPSNCKTHLDLSGMDTLSLRDVLRQSVDLLREREPREGIWEEINELLNLSN